MKHDPETRRALLTFVVVGGGPTGVETAGALAELIRLVMTKDYPHMDLQEVRVLLLEAADHLMGTYPPGLRRATYDLLAKKHVEILLSARLADYDGMHITLGDNGRIATQTLIWTAGVRAAELVDQLGIYSRRLPGGWLWRTRCSCPASPKSSCWGMRRTWSMTTASPCPCWRRWHSRRRRPPRPILPRLVSGKSPENFRYKDPGLLATIGRNAAVARIWGLSFSGFIAWVIWVGLHIYRLIGFRNRLVVMINWAWDYVFYENQVRLITGD